ncbi:histidine kinase/response regulator protein [Afipia carboxidovorans OM5]|uniref:histidine kinase n=1 Tax=Afipia carboxidovorans (strain ATCC 49405 / DSM 1227 / KCTC 32145 / OM5) TaxID=504832 RepID=F8BRW4_AFIC5|nr:ATP-binding protein [Afipia carboxidovorans]AEI04250.1 histidine kinase/response regulator protein [Afipia carboxidovorans OM4]AEI07880.1 histidine kinase/response regulator protein [Afipia carboxidovorans OM5]
MATKPRSTRRLKTSKIANKTKGKVRSKTKPPPAGQPAKTAASKRAVSKRALPKGAQPKRTAPTRKTRVAPAKPPRASSQAKPSDKPARGLVEAALAAFAHEVRTPLTGILAISSLLETSDLGARERRWVETIRAGAEHLAALATLYVDAAKSTATGLQVRQDFFDLRALARAAGDGLAGRAAANGLQAEVHIADDLPAFVTGDVVRLRAALENLIDNAVKFTPSGLVALDVAATIRRGHEAEVTFAVSDSGIGLSLAQIKRLFKPFSQASIDVASRFGGAGLGLWSVKQLARAMGGDVGVTQRKGHDTVFNDTVFNGTVFTLAVRVGLPREAQQAPSGEQAAYAGALRILSVEDNPFGRVVLNTVLGELGHHVEFVGQGELAAERVAGGNFDVVLMDMVLPGIDGVETIRRLRALPAGQPLGIIGISGREQDEAKARAAGADAFLMKPVSPRALAAALSQAKARQVLSGE